MTTPSQTPFIKYIGNGITDEFPFPFKTLDISDLTVTVDGVAVAFTADGIGNNTGSVNISPAPAVDAVIYIYRNIDIKRLIDYQTNGALLESVLDDDFDYAVMMLQQLNFLLSKMFRLTEVLPDVDMTFPDPVAGRAIVWNADGTQLENSEILSPAELVAAATEAVAATAAAITATTNANTAADSANTAKIVWLGDWDSGTAYTPNDAVQYNGTSYIAHTANTNEVPPNASYWDVLAQKGAAGAGFGDMVTTENLNDVANKQTARTNLAVPGLATVNTFTQQQTVPNDPYTTDWQNNDEVPTKEDLFNILDNEITVFTTGGTAPAFAITPNVQTTFYNIKAHAAGATGSNTFDDGSGAKPLKQYGPAGALVDGVVSANQYMMLRDDGTNWIILNASADASKLNVAALQSLDDAEQPLAADGCILSNGRLATWGYAQYGQLGLGIYVADIVKPGYAGFNVPIPDGVSVVDFKTTGYVSYALLSNGWVYSCGKNNSYFALGHGDATDRDVFTRVEYFVTNSITITKLVLSSSRVVPDAISVYALSDAGDVYTCGYNAVGQLGRGDNANKNTFDLVTSSIPAITDIATIGGFYNAHAILLDVNGDVWTTGYNGYGQLGLGDTTNRNVFTQVTSFASPVVKMQANGGTNSAGSPSAFGGNSLVILDNGDVYTCGYNGYGQLGPGDTTNRSSFVKITTLSNITDAKILGGHYGYAYAINSSGQLYTWGRNSVGVCGLGDTTLRNAPVLVDRWSGGVEAPPFENKVVKVVGRQGVGYEALFILDSDGNIYLSGYDTYGISAPAGHKNVFTPITPFALKSGSEKIINITVYGYDNHFTLQALSDQGNMYQSGYNYYGIISCSDEGAGQAYKSLTMANIGHLL